jgi:hypothetical protein
LPVLSKYVALEGRENVIVDGRAVIVVKFRSSDGVGITGVKDVPLRRM